MTIYGRPDEKVMAESAHAGEVQDFPDILRGWGIAFDQTGGIPPVEWFNALAKRTDQAIRYFMQRGLPEWSATEDYPQGAYVQYAFQTYYSKRSNANKQPGAAGSTNDWGRWSVTRDEFLAATSGRRLLNVRSLTGSGSFVPSDPNGYAHIRGCGAGGGGQANASNGAVPGFGGGGGGYFEWFGPLSALGAGPTFSYAVGAAGAPGTAAGQTGASGGNTTFAGQLSGNGGGGGGVNGGGTIGAGGSASILVAGALLVIPGREGQGSASSNVGGAGGNAYSGPGGVPHTTLGGVGVAGGGGAGGGGATGVQAGGSGGAGYLIITEYTG